MRFLTAIAVIVACAGCGSDDIVVDVASQRRVPIDVDTLRITVSNVAQTDVLRSLVVRLVEPFPAAILFEAGEETPDRVRIEVEARLGNTLVDSASAEAGRDEGTTRVRINLD